MLKSWSFGRQLRLIGLAAGLAIGFSLIFGALLVYSYDRLVTQVEQDDLPELSLWSAAMSNLADTHSNLVWLVATAREGNDEQAIDQQGKAFTKRLNELAEQFELQADRSLEKYADSAVESQRLDEMRDALDRFKHSAVTAVEMLTVNPALSDRFLVDSALSLNQLNQRFAAYIEAKHKNIQLRLDQQAQTNFRNAVMVGFGMLLLCALILLLINHLTRKLAGNFRFIRRTLEELRDGRTDIVIDQVRQSEEMMQIASSLIHFRDTLSELDFQKFAVDQHAIVSSTDVAGNITYVNDCFCEISGYSRDELLGKNHRIIKSDIHPPEIYREMWRTIAQGNVWHGEVQNRKKDGGFYWVAATIVPFIGPQGKPVKYTSIRTDITAQKILEATLLHARKLADQASAAKSLFLANMSHEIRTPMNGIIGMTDLALDTALNDEQREFISVVKTSAESLLTIINDILDFSKIEAGKLEVERIGFNLPETVMDTLKTLRLRASEKRVELICDVADDVPEGVFSDPGRLRQVLLNIVGNAIKFTEAGEVVLALTVVHGTSQTAKIRFSVRDTGIGIPADKIGHIFESFSQVDETTTRRFGGTGLGLTISSRLVDLMGGQLQVESELGVGSNFHFELTLEIDPAQVARIEPSSVSLADKHCLVVDDNAVNRQVFVRQLSRCGMQVTTARSGELAQRALSELPLPDVILLDVHMPDMDGFMLATWIKAQAALVNIPVLMLSSGPMAGDAERCRVMGIASHHTKPVSNVDLQKAVALALAGVRKIEVSGVVSEPVVIASAPGIEAAGLAILLVEDNLINQRLAMSLLKKWGHHVTLAVNGQEAVDQLASGGQFDLVLMDMQMPVMDGIEATQEIRRQEQARQSPRIRIVAMTANAMQGDREACIDAGMDDYLSKPIKQSELLEKLGAI